MPEPVAKITPAPPVVKPTVEQRLEALEHAVESLGAHLIDAERQDLRGLVEWYLKRVTK